MKKPALRFSVKLDLSKDRLKLLKYAINVNNASEGNHISYIFADINCNLVCKLNNDEYKYFNNEYQFHTIKSMEFNPDMVENNGDDVDNNNNNGNGE